MSVVLRPSRGHEHLRAILLELAQLLGYRLPIVGLPDGTQPDVLQRHPQTRGLFLGDAKWTEGPLWRETHQRLDGYADWIAVAAARAPGANVLALAFKDAGHCPLWTETLEHFVAKRLMASSVPLSRRLSKGVNVVILKV